MKTHGCVGWLWSLIQVSFPSLKGIVWKDPSCSGCFLFGFACATSTRCYTYYHNYIWFVDEQGIVWYLCSCHKLFIHKLEASTCYKRPFWSQWYYWARVSKTIEGHVWKFWYHFQNLVLYVKGFKHGWHTHLKHKDSFQGSPNIRRKQSFCNFRMHLIFNCMWHIQLLDPIVA